MPNRGNATPKQHAIAAWKDRDIETLDHIDSRIAVILNASIQRTPKEKQKWKLFNQEFAGV